MRLWLQVFSSRERNPNFHQALEQLLRSVAIMGTAVSRKMRDQTPWADVLAKAKLDYGIDL